MRRYGNHSGDLQKISDSIDPIRHYASLIAPIILGLPVSTGATAMDINVVGLFPNKAVVKIDALQTLSVGQKTRNDVILASVESRWRNV